MSKNFYGYNDNSYNQFSNQRDNRFGCRENIGDYCHNCYPAYNYDCWNNDCDGYNDRHDKDSCHNRCREDNFDKDCHYKTICFPCISWKCIKCKDR